MSKENSKNIDLQQNFNDIINQISVFDTTSLLSKCTKMDFQLLNLTISKGPKFQKENGIIPGYNSLLNTFAFLCGMHFDGRKCSVSDVAKFSEKLDKCILKDISDKGYTAINEIGRLQIDWQKKYIFKTYLLYLLISEKTISDLYKQNYSFDPLDLSGICLYNKFLSEPSVAAKLVECNIRPSTVIMNYISFLNQHFPFLTIELEEYKKRQLENFKNSNYDLFATRLLIRDFPIIVFKNQLFVSSYFYIQNSLYSRIIYILSNKGKFSKAIGDAYESVIFNSLKLCYSHISKDSLKDDPLQLNPRIKKCELCDVLVKKEKKYLLIDCKAKEFNETIYNPSSKELDLLGEKIIQRYKRIKDIKNRKFSKYFPTDVDIDNIYSLIVVVDDCFYSKNSCFEHLSLSLTEDEIEYCKKHIEIITYDDLLEYSVSDVDLIEIMERCKLNGKYINPLVTNIKQSDKKKYHHDFDKWYEDSKNRLLDLIQKYKILPFNI